MEKQVGCINIRPIIQYIELNAPDRLKEFYQDLGMEMEGIKDPRSFLTDLNNWVSSSLFIKLIERAKFILDDDNIAYKLGLHSIENHDLGYIQNIVILAIGSPYRAIKKSRSINSHFNKTKEIDIVDLRKNSCILRLKWFKEIPLTSDFCSLNKGVYSAIPRIWGLPYAELKEEKCFFKGDDYCEYHIGWSKGNLLLNFLRRFFAPWSLIKTSTAELEHDKAILKEKYDQIHHLNRDLHKRIEQLETLQESSSAILSTMETDELLDLVLRKLLKVAYLDRAAIFLLNKTKDILVPIHAVGVDDKVFMELKEYEIPVSKKDNIIARSVQSEKPIVIRDVSAVGLNPKNVLLKTFNPQAFVLVPIAVKGKTIGIMVGDNSQGKEPLADIDGNFLASFANHIAMTLENQTLYKKLEESEKKYRQIVENANEGIILTKPDGTISFSNQYFKNLLGVDNFLDVKLCDLVHEKEKDSIQTILEESREDQSTESEVKFKGKDNTLLHLQLSNVPMVMDNEFKGTLSMVTDMTEKKQMEKRLRQRQKLESIGTMAGGIAHDFNNLLTGILGFTQLLKENTPNSPRIRKYFEIIDNSGERATNLINKILEFSSGNETDEPQSALLQDIVQDTMLLFKSSISKKIDILIDIPSDFKPIRCEAAQLQQIILNLLINAGDVLQDSGVISITAKSIYQKELKLIFCENNFYHHQYCHIQIVDNGMGMKKEVQERIFDPFYTTKEIGKGTGLGLSIVYGIIQNCNGIIEVDSEEGQGTTFHIYLPLVDEALESKRNIKGSDEVVSGFETVLVVDDEKSVRDLANEFLTDAEYNVVFAENGLEAADIYQARRDQIDLVILDFQMPGLDGGKTAELLKQINPDIKIIMCNGKDSLPFEGACQSDRFISKPFQLNKMLKMVREVLDS